jgi:uncharacterized protein
MTTIDPLTRRSIDLFLERVRPRYAIKEAWLYGSRARGDAREDSDVDLALVIEGDDRPASSIGAEMGGDTYDVMVETGQFVIPLPIAIEKWLDPEKHSNPYLLANVRREGIAL